MKPLFINGLKVQYTVTDSEQLVIGLYTPYAMTEEVKEKTLRMIGKYLVNEGFVNIPVDGEEAIG